MKFRFSMRKTLFAPGFIAGKIKRLFVFPDPRLFAWPTTLALILCLTALAPNLHLLALAPNLYLPALAYIFITSPGPEFAYTNHVSSIYICIYSPDLRFVLPVRGLDLHLPYYW